MGRVELGLGCATVPRGSGDSRLVVVGGLGHEGVLLVLLGDVELLQHLPRVVHTCPGHPGRVGGHGLSGVDHHHCRVHVRGLQVNLGLLEEVETGLLWHWGGCDGLLLPLNLLLLLMGMLLLLLSLLRVLLHNRLLWLLLLRGAGEYWHGFLILLLRVVAKHIVGVVNTAVAINHLCLGDRLRGGHGVLLLILLSIVIIFGGQVGLSVGGRVLGPLGLNVARLSDEVDQGVQLLVGGSGHCPGLN